VIDPAVLVWASDGKTGLHYFSEDADNDGSMKTGTVKATANGEEYTFKLGTKGSTKGVGYSGKEGSYVYLNGYKFAADADIKVQVLKYTTIDGRAYAVKKPVNVITALNEDRTDIGKYYVISSTGAIVKSGTKTDADGYKVKVSNYVITGIYNTNVDKTSTDYTVYEVQ